MLNKEVFDAVSYISADVEKPSSFWLARALAEATDQRFRLLGEHLFIRKYFTMRSLLVPLASPPLLDFILHLSYLEKKQKLTI